VKLTKHFDSEEFECPHCHRQEMDEDFIKKLETIRVTLNKPIRINSGWRCKTYNNSKKVRGKRNSAHLIGKAADIRISSSHDRYLVIDTCIKIGINRIGIGKNFLHLDSADESTGHPQHVIWHYYE